MEKIEIIDFSAPESFLLQRLLFAQGTNVRIFAFICDGRKFAPFIFLRSQFPEHILALSISFPWRVSASFTPKCRFSFNFPSPRFKICTTQSDYLIVIAELLLSSETFRSLLSCISAFYSFHIFRGFTDGIHKKINVFLHHRWFIMGEGEKIKLSVSSSLSALRDHKSRHLFKLKPGWPSSRDSASETTRGLKSLIGFAGFGFRVH